MHTEPRFCYRLPIKVAMQFDAALHPPSSTTDDCPPLKVKKLDPDAVPPQRASDGAAGYDLCAAEATVILPGTRKVVKTGLAVQVPPLHYGRVAPRSGLAFKFGIDIGAGVIDSVRLHVLHAVSRSRAHALHHLHPLASPRRRTTVARWASCSSTTA